MQELRVEMGLSREEWKKESYVELRQLLERRDAKALGQQRNSERESNRAKHKSQMRKK